MDGTGRDRLRELLDAVLDEDNTTLDEMARGAFSSTFHFSRQLSRGAGEPPVAMRRRVMLERSAWQLRGGSSVTEVAFAAGYDSAEGFSRAFSRAFGHPPSVVPETPGHWLPAPNGIHFHPPMSLWVDSRADHGGDPSGAVTAQLVHHDLDDVRELLELAKGLSEQDYGRVRLPGNRMLEWGAPDDSIEHVLHHLVREKEMWLASLQGADLPPDDATDAVTLIGRHDAVAPRWLATVRDIDRRGAWDDRLVDALCEPPESFVLGSVLAHVLTFSAARRQLVRQLLRATSTAAAVDDGDPINWFRRRRGEQG